MWQLLITGMACRVTLDPSSVKASRTEATPKIQIKIFFHDKYFNVYMITHRAQFCLLRAHKKIKRKAAITSSAGVLKLDSKSPFLRHGDEGNRTQNEVSGWDPLNAAPCFW